MLNALSIADDALDRAAFLKVASQLAMYSTSAIIQFM